MAIFFLVAQKSLLPFSKDPSKREMLAAQTLCSW